MTRNKYQLIHFTVTAAGAVVNINANSDRLYKRITGLFASLPDEKSLQGSSLQLHVNDQEVFPEGFEIKFLSCSEHVSPNERFFQVEEEADGSTLRAKFTDNGLATSYPFTGTLTLKLEEKNN